MKKELIFAVFALSLIIFNFARLSAQDETPITEEDAEKIQNAIDQIPLDESGEIDQEKLEDYTSTAEQRIAKINSWLDKNAEWLKVVFGMKPAVSGVFFLNLFLIIVFLVYFRNGLAFSSFSDNICTILAFLMTILFIQFGLIAKISESIINLLSKWWLYLIAIILLIAISALGRNLGKVAEEWKLHRKDRKLDNLIEQHKGADNIAEAYKAKADAEIVREFAKRIAREE
jgi:hypothetical protein